MFKQHTVSILTLILTLSTSSSCGLISPRSSKAAQVKDLGDTQEVLRKLGQLSSDIAVIQKTVMINDQARLQVLSHSITFAAEMVKAKGVAHIKSINSLRKLVMYFIYSEQFFQFIRTERNGVTIDKVLLTTIDVNSPSIRVDIGYDEDPMGTILADNLEVIQQRTSELMAASELPENVRNGLKPLMARIGFVLGLAQGQGDRPIPYAEGTKLCAEIDAIYPLLDQLNGSQQFFQRAQDIRGTNEFLKDFLQVSQQERP